MAIYSWPQLINKVYAFFPNKTDIELAEKFQVTRQTIAAWRKESEAESKDFKAPDWKSVEFVALALLKAVEEGEIKPKSIEEMSLIGWAHQVKQRRAYFSTSNFETIRSFYEFEKVKIPFLKEALIGGSAGAGIGAISFMFVGAALGPLGVAVGGAIGAITGYFISNVNSKENKKLRDDFDQFIEDVADEYKLSVEKFVQSILTTDSEFSRAQNKWQKKLETIFKENKAASARLEAKKKDMIIEKIRDLPSPLAIFDLDVSTINNLLGELKLKK